MANEPSLKKNIAWSMGFQMLSVITPFITAPYVSRVLEPDGVGINSYTTSLVTFFTLFAALGVMSYGTREIARVRDNDSDRSKAFWGIEAMVALSSFASLVTWLLFARFYTQYSIFLLALSPLILGTALDISWYFTGLEQMKKVVIRNATIKLVGIALLFLLIHNKGDLTLYILMNSLVVVFGNLTMWTHLPRTLIRVSMKDLGLKTHFKKSAAYFVPTIAISVYTVLDKTLIGIITGDVFQNGYYEQANKIISMAKTISITALNTVMSARMSHIIEKGWYRQAKELLEKSMGTILFFCAGFAFGIAGISDTFVPLFFGMGYEAVIPILRCMCPLIIIIGISNCLYMQYYIASGEISKSSKYIVSGACVNLALNCILIPFFGSLGAVAASIIAESIITALHVRGCPEYMNWPLILKIGWKKMLAGSIMLLTVVLIGTIGNGLAVITSQVLVGAAVYLLVLAITKDKTLYDASRIIVTRFSLNSRKG